MRFQLAYLDLTLARSKDQIGRWNNISQDVLAFMLFNRF